MGLTEREQALRIMADDLGVPPELVDCVDSACQAARQERERQRDEMLQLVAEGVPRVEGHLTSEILRPALEVAGVPDAERYRVVFE
jgi:uncharacterized alpha-E superfamily protein